MIETKRLCTETTHLPCGNVRCAFYADHVVAGIPHRGAITWDVKVKHGYKDPWVEWACQPAAYAQADKR